MKKTKRYLCNVAALMMVVSNLQVNINASVQSMDVSKGELLEVAYEEALRRADAEKENMNESVSQEFLENQAQSEEEYEKLYLEVYNEKKDTYQKYYSGA